MQRNPFSSRPASFPTTSVPRHGKQRRRRRKDRRLPGRTLAFEPLENRLLLAGESLAARFEFTNLSGGSVSTVQAGQDFLLKMYVRDIRSSPQGVFQAYFDVNYDSSLASVAGPIIHGPEFSFPGSLSGDTSTPGLIDEVGGIDTDQIEPVPGGTEELLFSVRLHANDNASGPFQVTGDLGVDRTNLATLVPLLFEILIP